MVDFLLQDGVCETLLGFVTQIAPGQEKNKRIGQDDPQPESMKFSYRFYYITYFN
jgi:hypothetical protein